MHKHKPLVVKTFQFKARRFLPLKILIFLLYSSFDIRHDCFLIYHDDNAVYCMRIDVAVSLRRNSCFCCEINHITSDNYASKLYNVLLSITTSYFVRCFLYCYFSSFTVYFSPSINNRLFIFFLLTDHSFLSTVCYLLLLLTAYKLSSTVSFIISHEVFIFHDL